MNIVRTHFTDYRTGQPATTYGFRAYDDQEQTYSNLMEKVELDLDVESFLRNIIAQYADDTFTRLFNWALHHTNFIVIDDVEYSIVHDDKGWKLVEKN